jgi:ATP-dependent RNA helicase DDX35
MSFHDYFCSGISPQEATIISLEGRMYPVEVAYLTEPATDYIKMAVEVTWKINLQHVAGDILVFLTGREDIERFLEAISELIPTCEANTSKFAGADSVSCSACHVVPHKLFPWRCTQV